MTQILVNLPGNLNKKLGISKILNSDPTKDAAIIRLLTESLKNINTKKK